MRSSTSVWSAICGTHFGDTNAVASTARSPASASRSMSSSLTAVGTSPGSFCSPSRGPTSTIFTKLLKRNELRAFQYLLAGGEMHFLDHAVGGRGDGVLHFHGLENQQRLALFHLVAGARHHLDDLAGHRRRERAAARVLVVFRQRLLEREVPVASSRKDVPVGPLAHRACAKHAAVQPDAQCAAFEHVTRQRMLAGMEGD